MKKIRYLIPLALLTCTASSFSFANDINEKLVRGNSLPTNQLRIINGFPVEISERPYQVGLVSSGQSATNAFCGGSLISPSWVLTAAHCVENSNPGSVDVIGGAARLNDPSMQRYRAERIIVHPNYNSAAITNDIALIKLATPSNLPTVDYRATSANNATNTPVTVSGWGNMSPQGQNYPMQLQAVDLTISNFNNCSAAYGGLSNVHLCASNPGGTKDSCYGDSGGPLTTRVGSRDVQVGVVSFGAGCASATQPGVYVRVSQFQDFINNNIGNDQPPVVEVPPVVEEPPVVEVPPVVEEPPVVEVPPVVEEPPVEEVPPVAAPLYPMEIIVGEDFGTTFVGFQAYGWVAVFNASSGPSVVASNFRVNEASGVQIANNQCENRVLQADEYCTVELNWTPQERGRIRARVSMDLFDGGSTTTVENVIVGKALGWFNIGSYLDLPGVNFFSSGADDWLVSSEKAFSGSESLVTGDLSDLEPAVLQGDFDIPVASKFSFSFMAQGGVLDVIVNGEPLLSLDTMFDWGTASLEVEAGSSIFWSFTPDSDVRQVAQARIDNVKIEPLAPTEETTEADMTGGTSGGGALGPLGSLFLLGFSGFMGFSCRSCREEDELG